MTDPGVESRPSSDELCVQSKSLKQSDWMGHWLNRSKRTIVDNSSLQLRENGLESLKRHLSTSCNQVVESNELKSVNGSSRQVVAEDGSLEVMNKFMTNEANSKKEQADLPYFPMFGFLRNGGNGKQVLSSHVGKCKEPHAVAVGSVMPNVPSVFRGSRILPKETAPNLELELGAHGSAKGNCAQSLSPSHGDLLGTPSGFPYGIMYRQGRVTPFASTSKEPFTLQSSFHEYNIETVGVSSTLDAGEDIHLGRPLYAKTTRHFLITENTAIGVLDEGNIFRESILSTEFNGNLGGLLSLAPASGQIRQGVQIQLLDGSTYSERKDRDTEECKKEKGNQSIGRLYSAHNTKNETSSETRTMEVDVSLDNRRAYDFAVSGLKKDALKGKSTASSKGKSLNTRLPDMNEEAVGPDDLANEGEQSTSRTQSLDMECLVSHDDFPVLSKSIPFNVTPMDSEPSSHWVKRLKLSGLNSSALGTKSATIQESSHEKLHKFSNKFLFRNNGLTSSEPAVGSFLKHNAEHWQIDKASNLLNGGKASSMESLKKDKDALLSHSWIRRWRHKKPALLTNHLSTVDLSQPHSPKVPFDDFQKKSFPSIAAMALMGKAMNGFRPCEFTNKGSFIVWNTNSYPSD